MRKDMEASGINSGKVVSQLDADGCYCRPTVADESPLESGVYLIPGGAVDIAPPELVSGKAFRPREDHSGWLAVDDNRGAVLYRTSDGQAYEPGRQHGEDGTYAGLGPIPGWLTTEARPDPWSVWNSGAWVRDEAAWRASVVAGNIAKKSQMTADANGHIATLQDAVDLGIATEQEVAALKLWRVYRVELSRVDVSAESPVWPVEPTA
ncbi:tail fiber assembly protein [Bordetella avium]|uniref:tail fiber assembly protein n=2 Tax=Bordetella avium TaxID=521 RepID=UPI000E0A2E44|nr:hypothetical protein D0432_16690 [Bordetella avium]UOK17567.1 tail fiber assembly [Bordetella phage vB_BaM-IFTN9]RIQ17440.1 hypothetical protein D0850_11290 [Bordetella avium]RIQ42351.1 hypothetical protein D0847_10585 [Bordetella avium]RIQ42801.1 hypothetical protein D0846_12085 [Bordetella avium]